MQLNSAFKSIIQIYCSHLAFKTIVQFHYSKLLLKSSIKFCIQLHYSCIFVFTFSIQIYCGQIIESIVGSHLIVLLAVRYLGRRVRRVRAPAPGDTRTGTRPGDRCKRRGTSGYTGHGTPEPDAAPPSVKHKQLHRSRYTRASYSTT